MSVCMVFGHQCERRRQGVLARHSATQNPIALPLELWGPDKRVECKAKFGVADVAYRVVSLGKMIESGFTFSFDDNKCYMHKGNQRVEIFRTGRFFVLRMSAGGWRARFKWLHPLMRLLTKKWSR